MFRANMNRIVIMKEVIFAYGSTEKALRQAGWKLSDHADCGFAGNPRDLTGYA